MTELTTEMIPAFNAAYDALGPYTLHAQLREAVASEIATELWDVRSQHGMGLMQQVADDQEMRTRHVSGFVASFRAQNVTAVGLAATDKAVQAGAKVLAAG